MTRFLCLLCLVCGMNSQASLTFKDTGEQEITKDARDGQSWRRVITLQNDLALYEIRMHREVLAAGAPGGRALIAAVEVNHLYRRPAFSFNITDGAGLSLAQQPYTVDTRVGNLDRKAVIFRWQTDTRSVELTFVLEADQPQLFARFLVSGEQPYHLLMNMAPGGYAPKAEDRDRRMLLPGEHVASGERTYPLAEIDWLLLYDTKLAPSSNPHAGGAFGLAWNAPAGSTVETECRPYVSPLRLRIPEGGSPVILALYSFEHAPNKEAIEMIQKVGTSLASGLSTKITERFDVPKKIRIPIHE